MEVDDPTTNIFDEDEEHLDSMVNSPPNGSQI